MPAASPCRSSCATAASTSASCRRITDAIVANAQTQIAPAARAARRSAPMCRSIDVEVDRDQGADAARHRSTRSSRRCRPISARPTSTSSTSSAAPSRSTSRPTRSSGCRRDDIDNLTVRNQQRRHDAARHAGRRSRRRSGPSLISLYNLYPSATIIGLPAQGFSSGQAMALMEQIAAQDPAARHRLRMDRDVVPGEDRRQPDLLRLRARAAAGLSRARRPVRELVRADLGDPGGAAGAARPGVGAARRCGIDEQSLHPDRPHPADRAVGQERDPDRRGRARAARPRRQAASWRRRSRRRARASGRS